MPLLKLVWTHSSKLQFEELRQKAESVGRGGEFTITFNEIAAALKQVELALEKGEPLYHTRKSGGVVRQWVHRFICITYVVFPDDALGWVTKFQSVPSTWPD
jgi:hypothetical protein